MDEIQAVAVDLLKDQRVSCFIGYEEGTRDKVRPAFIYEPQEASRLIWDERCTHNLTIYLHQFGHPIGQDEPQRVGVLVKPCDSQSLNVLLHEQQLDRTRVHIVGVTCEGVKDDGSFLERCRHCEQRVPLIYDVLIGEEPEESGHEDYQDVVELENMPPGQRLAYWTREFDRCIRCYACRQVCPGCYCSECVAEQLEPRWMGIAIDLPQKQFFHIMRAYHLAGRCSDCNACEEACPVGIPLSLINRKVAKEVEALFAYRTGQDEETPPPLATFRQEEELRL